VNLPKAAVMYKPNQAVKHYRLWVPGHRLEAATAGDCEVEAGDKGTNIRYIVADIGSAQQLYAEQATVQRVWNCA